MTTDVRQARIREGMELARERGEVVVGRPCPRCSAVIDSITAEMRSPTQQHLEASPCGDQWVRWLQ
jgi:hypothetical protein